jgi:hypothetical protein
VIDPSCAALPRVARLVLPVSEGARLPARGVRLDGAVDLAGVALPARAVDLLGIGIDRLVKVSVIDFS